MKNRIYTMVADAFLRQNKERSRANILHVAYYTLKVISCNTYNIYKIFKTIFMCNILYGLIFLQLFY